tara:strand:+ start:3776 stop:5806 length:2031 start_codon:yes stop_codon:yes gene_type:complete
MIELYVENNKVDINESFSTILTLAIDDIKDFGAKNSTFSKTILLPGTKNNNKLFGNIFSINAANEYNSGAANVGINFNAAIAANAIIFADNMQVFKGIFRVLEVIVDDGFIEYECAVFGELGGFIASLGTKKLEDLDFGIADVAWTNTNIANSWNSIAGSGVYFPLIDYGAVSSNKVDFDFKAFRPALYVKEYLTNIINTSGYTWDFPLLSTSLFNRLIIPNNQKSLTKSSTTAFKASVTDYTYTSASAIKFTSITSGSFSFNTGTDLITYGGASAINTNISLMVSGQINSIDPSNTFVNFEFMKGATLLAVEIINASYTPYYFTVNLSVSNVTINPSDTLAVNVVTSGLPPNYRLYGDNFKIETTTPTDVQLNYGDNIVINDTIPKGILQKDFFSSIVKMFNLYIFEDYTTEKKIKISPFVTFYEDATAVDWSLKVDRSKPMRIKPMSELNSRYYGYKYKSDNDFYAENYRKKYNEGYGDYIYDSFYEFAKETTTVELIFAQSVLYQYNGTDKIYPAIYKLSNSNQAEDKIDSVIRILQAKKITGVSSWALKNGGTTLASYTAYGYAGHLDDPITSTFDLNFGVPKEIIFTTTSYTPNNLFNVYWSTYLAEITDKDSRLLTVTMKLSNKDIYNLDFSKLIWVDGVLYRLNKIEDFNASKEDTSKVELVKIINRIY